MLVSGKHQGIHMAAPQERSDIQNYSQTSNWGIMDALSF